MLKQDYSLSNPMMVDWRLGLRQPHAIETLTHLFKVGNSFYEFLQGP